MGSRQSFHVTGASCRASGYGEPAGQYLPTPGPLECAPLLTLPGFAHASRIAAAQGSVREAAADRLRISLLVMLPCPVGRSFGCLAMAASDLHQCLSLNASSFDWWFNGNLRTTPPLPQPLRTWSSGDCNGTVTVQGVDP